MKTLPLLVLGLVEICFTSSYTSSGSLSEFGSKFDKHVGMKFPRPIQEINFPNPVPTIKGKKPLKWNPKIIIVVPPTYITPKNPGCFPGNRPTGCNTTPRGKKTTTTRRRRTTKRRKLRTTKRRQLRTTKRRQIRTTKRRKLTTTKRRQPKIRKTTRPVMPVPIPTLPPDEYVPIPTISETEEIESGDETEKSEEEEEIEPGEDENESDGEEEKEEIESSQEEESESEQEQKESEQDTTLTTTRSPYLTPTRHPPDFRPTKRPDFTRPQFNFTTPYLKPWVTIPWHTTRPIPRYTIPPWLLELDNRSLVDGKKRKKKRPKRVEDMTNYLKTPLKAVRRPIPGTEKTCILSPPPRSEVCFATMYDPIVKNP